MYSYCYMCIWIFTRRRFWAFESRSLKITTTTNSKFSELWIERVSAWVYDRIINNSLQLASITVEEQKNKNLKTEIRVSNTLLFVLFYDENCDWLSVFTMVKKINEWMSLTRCFNLFHVSYVWFLYSLEIEKMLWTLLTKNIFSFQFYFCFKYKCLTKNFRNIFRVKD